MTKQLTEFVVVLSDGVYTISSTDHESAAWTALELSEDRDSVLIDVHYKEEWI